jgi:peptidoglycan/xylan/chitin deacetylase (PgdA/CDA1 family)
VEVFNLSKIKMKVAQCWDDGVIEDVPLIDILRKYNAKATFNLNLGLYQANRSKAWIIKGNQVYRLAKYELKDLYRGFMIGNHSLNHLSLDEVPLDVARREIVEGREQLQQFFNQPVVGFAYPYSTFTAAVTELVREAGHLYARTGRCIPKPNEVPNMMVYRPTCHFLDPDFFLKYEKAKSKGFFYFFGHSYEMRTPEMWQDFEDKIKRISADPDVYWVDVPDLISKIK